MELVAFILLFVLGSITILLEKNLILKYLYIPALFIFMIIVRIHGFSFGGYQKDVLTYAIEMKEISFHFYYLREFVFWFGLKVLYTITQSELLTFILLDILWIYFLLKIFKTESVNKLGKGAVVVLVTCFPFLFGYENIYRQFYASIILLYSYSLIEVNPSKSLRFFIISFFIHNLVLFLIPIFIVKKCFSFNFKDRITIAIIISLCFVGLLPFISHLKDADPTKVDMSIAYLILFLSVFSFFIFKFKENIYNIISEIPSLLFFVILMLGYVLFRQEMIAERLGMMFIIFLIYDLYRYSSQIENKLKRIALRLVLLFVFTLPVLLFDSSMRFLI